MIDKLCMWVAHRLPRRLQYWVVQNVWAEASTHKHEYRYPPEITLTEALTAWVANT